MALRSRTKKPTPSRDEASSLDDATRKRLVAAMVVGCGLRVAARVVDAPLAALKRAMDDDHAFRESLLAAEAKCEFAHLRILHEAARDPKNFRISMWFLECRFPARYTSRPPKSITAEQLTPSLQALAQVLVDEVDADTRGRLVERLAAVLGEQSVHLQAATHDEST